jgi:hypothetical protein
MSLFKYLLIGLCAGLCAGCSSGPEPPDQEMIDLQEVKQVLHMAARRTNRPPARLADLDPFQAKYQEAYNSVKSGDFVVLWGTPVLWGMPNKKGVNIATSEVVLAYGKNVPANGGYVLTSAGNVSKMTPAEFASAPKAKK